MIDTRNTSRPTDSADTKSPAGASDQQELLRRGLVRVSIAADGLDPLLDKRLKELRSALRNDAPPHLLTELMPELERAVLAADSAREERMRNIGASLRTLVKQLQQRRLSGEVGTSLKELAQRLNAPIEYASTVERLIADIASSQAQVLNAAPGEAPSGLLARLFGSGSTPGVKKTAEEQETPETPETPEPIIIEQPATSTVKSEPDALIPELPAKQEHSIDSSAEKPDEDAVVGNLGGEEQQYSKAAAHIETVLLNLISELQVLDSQRIQTEQLRERIAGGLNWYELAAALDELALLVLGAQQNRQQDFELYLKQLNSRLAQFQGNLEEAHDAYTGSLEVGRALEGTIRDQVQDLHGEVSSATDLDTLKANVQSQLDALLVNVEQSRTLHLDREQQVAGRLKSMVDRIATMEVEATTFRNHLEEQRKQAMIDTLTGLPNRAGLQKRMNEEYERWQRYGGQLLLVVLDVDHFKRVNDQFGHLAGDKVLRLIAQQLSRRLRKSDFIGRFGGEEFVILMPGTSIEHAAVVLEELRAGIEESPFHFKKERVTITISIGYTDFRQSDSLEEIFERADQAMYRAKDSGRNSLVRAD
ncbi:GGDEF domain-containing protein [Halopseudomonas salina]|uniref:diguanylate cyclase n=1 Tax=Halopseudomonas salina TaxID=1323744 RepID=A0ABQ1P9V2_9GAMM|nr:GGDEF domain-containing protein [Halopseudomonas salina]GGC93450.1 GGDEF domain-containing protein [Halopseudomonas salina]